VGVAVTSHNANETVKGVFSHLAIRGEAQRGLK
jgi:hypothetical protein